MADKFDDKEILNIEEAAEYLSFGRRTIYKLIKEKKIPHKKVLNKFRFVKQDLKDWVRGDK
jgi:excisionase family DNA binding protein